MATKKTQEREVILSVRNLCQYFGPVKAVDDVSFDVYKGEVLGLVGESGCGKTTTGRSIIKLYDITSGSVYFHGLRISAGVMSYKKAIKEAKNNPNLTEEERKKIIEENKKEIEKAKYDSKNVDKIYQKQLLEQLEKEYKEKLANASESEKEQITKDYNEHVNVCKKERLVTKIQMIFQDPIASLDPRMTVKQIISEGLIIKGIKNKEYIDKKVYEVLDFVGLVEEHAGRYPHEFSGGQRQRIGVARTVVMEPDLIIADEPVSALDVSIQAQVINLLDDLREKKNVTIIFIAHDLSVVKYFSDRIGVMYFGNLVELTTSEELFKNPLHPYTRSLLSAIPLPDPDYEKRRVRITYNPLKEHDYSVDKPSLREIAPGHFVRCNDVEETKYKKMLKQ